MMPSYFNHKCEFNTTFMIDKDTKNIFFKTIRDIKCGEELTINYTEEIDTYNRKISLLEKGVVCNCKICKGEIYSFTPGILNIKYCIFSLFTFCSNH